MNPDLKFLYSDPTGWVEVRSLLEQQVGQLPQNTWKPILHYTSEAQRLDPAHISRELMRVYSEHADGIFRVVIFRHEHDEWPEVSPEATYYLRQMHGRALCFLQGILFQPHGTPETIFRFPEAHPKDVILWILTDWWLEHGLQENLYEISHRQEPPPFAFSKS
jgi:hypothetical protein